MARSALPAPRDQGSWRWRAAAEGPRRGVHWFLPGNHACHGLRSAGFPDIFQKITLCYCSVGASEPRMNSRFRAKTHLPGYSRGGFSGRGGLLRYNAPAVPINFPVRGSFSTTPGVQLRVGFSASCQRCLATGMSRASGVSFPEGRKCLHRQRFRCHHAFCGGHRLVRCGCVSGPHRLAGVFVRFSCTAARFVPRHFPALSG